MTSFRQWLSSGSGTDDDAIHDNVAGEISSIAEKASPDSNDVIIVEDSSSSNAKKKVKIGNLPTGTGMSSFDVAGDSGSDQTIAEGNTLTIAGGAGVSTEASATDTLTVSLSDEAYTSAEKTKLSGIEESADVTDADNVNSAGAVMESDFNATTFLYATADNTPLAKTPAEVRSILNVADGADVTASNAPQSHANSHASGQSDALKLDDLAAPDDNTDLDASSTAHGLLKKLDANTDHFLRGDGTWAEPPVAAGWDGDIADIDLDGGTDIDAALADADLILVDDGAGGTNRKSAISRVWTYINSKIAALFTADGDILVGTGAGTYQAESGATARTSLGLAIGTDVLAQQTIGIGNDNLVEIDDADAASGDFAKFTANGLEGRSASEVRSDLDLEIGTDVLAQQTIGIADNNLVEMDSASAASGEIARFTANGLESRSDAEMKTQLGYLTDLVDDLSPQLGGALDVNGKSVVSASDGDIAITPNGTGDLILDGLKWPQADGTDGQVLKTNGTAQLSWTTASGGGVDTSGTPEALDFARFTDTDTIEGLSYSEVKAALNLEIGTDVLAQQTIGIANDNLVEMDDADAADDDYAKFTANGLEGRSYAEVKTDLGIDYQTIYIDAGAMVPCTTNGAEASTEEYGTNDIDMDVLAFDAGATEERAQFKLVMPENWDRSTVKVKFYWGNASGASASDTIEWGIKAGALSNDDAIDAALGTPQVISDTVIADGDLHITSTTPALTVGGTPALGDLVVFEVYRNTDGTDDMAEDGWLFGCLIQYKIDQTVSAW